MEGVGEDEDGCVKDGTCRGSDPMKRCLSLSAVFIRFQAPISLYTSNTVVGGGFRRQRGRRWSIWMGSIREVGDRNLFSDVCEKETRVSSGGWSGHVDDHGKTSHAWQSHRFSFFCRVRPKFLTFYDIDIKVQ
ncbi:hypothetical protein Rs2_11729 [Raphanus sativus]|nr:hypothetical protein Rs2_11729 [Raphanus sativus]